MPKMPSKWKTSMVAQLKGNFQIYRTVRLLAIISLFSLMADLLIISFKGECQLHNIDTLNFHPLYDMAGWGREVKRNSGGESGCSGKEGLMSGQLKPCKDI